MNCVGCKEPMITLELRGVEIDHCISCGGVWLDSGELEILFEEPAEVEAFLKQFRAGKSTASRRRRCPICSKKMEEVQVGVAGSLLLDRCRNDHGIWFDRGELPAVLNAFDANNNNEVVSLLKGIFAQDRTH